MDQEKKPSGGGGRRPFGHGDNGGSRPLPSPTPSLPPDPDDESPFDHPSARAYSCYASILNPEDREADTTERLYKIPAGKLWPCQDDERVIPLAQVAHDQLRAHILGEYYPCIGGKSAFNQGQYRFGFYKELAHETSVLAHGHDLKRFVSEYRQLGDFTSFIAVFKYPQSTSEKEFETLLWKHLQALHDNDGDKWDPHYSPDPASPFFAFSFAACAFFIVGMHSGASRFSRRFAFPAIVMNPESQIHRLKRDGLFDRFAAQVRKRDLRYQGSINPSVPKDAANVENEARVYSGATHPPGSHWKCPFKPRPEVLANHVRIDPLSDQT
jgi:hypothetical protein